MKMHYSVLLEESVSLLNIVPDGSYVDATYGKGGHSRKIMEGLNDDGRLYGFDRDKNATKYQMDDDRFQLATVNYRHIDRVMDYYGEVELDGVLADLGLSSMQLDQPEYGMAFRFDAPLDMRMNQQQDLSAKEVVNEYSEEDLADLFTKYGEVTNGKQVAQSLVAARKLKSIETTEELKSVVMQNAYGNKVKYLAKVFQGIRIEVNDELSSLEEFLNKSMNLLRSGGRMAIITFHSLEDRIVKQFMKGQKNDNSFLPEEKSLKVITRKPIMATKQELQENNRSRSAKLRVAEKI